MQKDILKEFNANMRTLLDQGVIFWKQPWTSERIGFHMPVNASTGAPYKGINIFGLNAAAHIRCFKTREYATYKQWSELGEQVKAGEKGAPIYKYDTMEKPDQGDKVKKIPFIRKYTVFNRSQLHSFKQADKPEQPNLVESIDRFDSFIANTGVIIRTSDNGGAYYDPDLDAVYMPPKASFIDVQNVSATVNWCDTLAHETNHWTGIPSRLNRKAGKKYGDKGYAEEELVAELGAVLLLHHLGIITEPTQNSVAYAAGWSKRLGEDDGLFWRAASEAGKSFDYLCAFQENKAANDNNPVQNLAPEIHLKQA